MTEHTNEKAIERIAALPECIRSHIVTDDPSWSYIPEGWHPLVTNLHNNLVQLHPDYKIKQIKEKFGGLRFYTDIPYDKDDIASILIHHYEVQSYHACDQCGERGTKVSINGRNAVRCQKHK